MTTRARIRTSLITWTVRMHPASERRYSWRPCGPANIYFPAGEFSVDLYTIPDGLGKMLWDFLVRQLLPLGGCCPVLEDTGANERTYTLLTTPEANRLR